MNDQNPASKILLMETETAALICLGKGYIVKTYESTKIFNSLIPATKYYKTVN